MEAELCNIPAEMQKCRRINWGRAGKAPGEGEAARALRSGGSDRAETSPAQHRSPALTAAEGEQRVLSDSITATGWVGKTVTTSQRAPLERWGETTPISQELGCITVVLVPVGASLAPPPPNPPHLRNGLKQRQAEPLEEGEGSDAARHLDGRHRGNVGVQVGGYLLEDLGLVEIHFSLKEQKKVAATYKELVREPCLDGQRQHKGTHEAVH